MRYNINLEIEFEHLHQRYIAKLKHRYDGSNPFEYELTIHKINDGFSEWHITYDIKNPDDELVIKAYEEMYHCFNHYMNDTLKDIEVTISNKQYVLKHKNN